MPEERNQAGRLTRRGALKKIAGTAGSAVAFPVLSNAVPAGGMCSPGVSRATEETISYAPRFFNASQMEIIASLAELIIPADDHSPGARAANVNEYIDEIVAGASQSQKDSWVKGLAAIEQTAAHDYQKSFLQCDANQQAELVQEISANEGHPATPEEHFFAIIKNATIRGYYTSAIGIHQELEYQGNTALGEFEGCGHLPHKLESEKGATFTDLRTVV
jgi:glucoside 3-dehydrogenase (cytochrome c) hitch-hiker subunit